MRALSARIVSARDSAVEARTQLSRRVRVLHPATRSPHPTPPCHAPSQLATAAAIAGAAAQPAPAACPGGEALLGATLAELLATASVPALAAVVSAPDRAGPAGVGA